MPTPSRRSHTRPRVILLLLTALLLCAAARSQDLGGSTGERVKSAGSGKSAGHSQRSHTGRNQTSQNSKVNAVLEDALKHGEEELNASHFSEAEYAYKTATMLNDKDWRGYAGLGDVYYDQKKYDEAEKNYRLAFALADEKNKPYTELGSTALAQRRSHARPPPRRRRSSWQPSRARVRSQVRRRDCRLPGVKCREIASTDGRSARPRT